MLLASVFQSASVGVGGRVGVGLGAALLGLGVADTLPASGVTPRQAVSTHGSTPNALSARNSRRFIFSARKSFSEVILYPIFLSFVSHFTLKVFPPQCTRRMI
jgi:hypothetical protein